MRMPAGRKMPDRAHIFRPPELGWVLRTRDYEPAMGQFLSRTCQEFIHLRLAIGGIRPHIAQVACIAAEHPARIVVLGFERTIQRQRMAGAELALQLRQNRSSREAEVKIEAANLLRLQVRSPAGAKAV